MQLVINIPDSTITDLKKKQNRTAVDNAVLHGTPLPKGHGNLKDVDKIISEGISKGFCDWYDEMKSAQTIIKADKAESEKTE